jgi:hypothetical protein
LKSKEQFIKDFSLRSERSGIRPKVTEFVLREGPTKVLRQEFLRDQSLSINTIKKVDGILDDAFTKLGNQFDKQINPVLKDAKVKVKIDDVSDEFLDGLTDIFDFKKTKKGKIILSAKALSDKSSARDVGFVIDDLLKISINPTPKDVHKLKQGINKLVKKKAIMDVPEVKNKLFQLNKGLRERLDESVPRYKEITNNFRNVFELEESLGKELGEKRVESALGQYFDKNKEFFRSQIDDLMEKIPESKKVIKDALKERAAKEYVKDIPTQGKGIGIPLGAGIHTGIHIPGTTPLKQAARLRAAERRGTLIPRSERVLGAGKAQLLGAGLQQAPTRKEESRSAILR